jgi:hypothetical protein
MPRSGRRVAGILPDWHIGLLDDTKAWVSTGRMRFDVTTRASPGQVRQALTDFSDRRLQIWSRSLDPKTYEVRELGDTWAVARESTAGSPFWVVARYDWSDPAALRMTVEDCSWGGSGAGSVRVAPLDGGGSLVHAEWTYTGAKRTRDKVMLSLIQRFPMRRIIARGWVKALDRYAQSGLA